MRRFSHREIREAVAYAATGGQALHVWDASAWPGKAPAVFRRYKVWAHLLDQDRARLEATARRLGVRVVVVGNPGTPRQHIDLCGGPLTRALAECDGQPSAPSTVSTG